MRRLLLFVEDAAQEQFLRALIERLAGEASITLRITVRTAEHGLGRVLEQVRDFRRELEAGEISMPDGVVVGMDANCKGFGEARRRVSEYVGPHSDAFVYAIPDPHIERWFLLDGAAFREVVGRGCQAPDAKCEKGRYKQLLADAIRAAGITPLFGGIENAEDIAQRIDLQSVADRDPSFNHFLSDFRSWLNRMRFSS